MPGNLGQLPEWQGLLAPRPLLSPGGLGAPLILWFLGNWVDPTSSVCPQGSVSVVNSEACIPKDAARLSTPQGSLRVVVNLYHIVQKCTWEWKSCENGPHMG